MEPQSELLPLAQGMKGMHYRSGRKFEKGSIMLMENAIVYYYFELIGLIFRYAGNPCDVLPQRTH